MNINNQCAACLSRLNPSDEELQTEINGFAIATCANCESGTALPRPTQKMLEEFYKSGDYDGQYLSNISNSSENSAYLLASKSAINDKKSRLKRFFRILGSKGMSQPTSVLDFGAGGGFTLLAAKQLGLEATGIEIDEVFISRCRALGLSVHRSLPEKPSKVELVTFFEVLEHLIEPIELLQKIHAQTTGKIVIAGSVPNYKSMASRFAGDNWDLLCPPEHLNFFSRKGLTKLIELGGYRVIWIGSGFRDGAPTYGFGTRKFIEKLVESGKLPRQVGRVTRLALDNIKRLTYFPLNMLLFPFQGLGEHWSFLAVKELSKTPEYERLTRKKL